jgi:predicted TIM-barrel fold metal-dependent hydrolase
VRPCDAKTEEEEALAMTMPTDIGAVDLMISFPVADHARTYDYLRPMLHDAGSGEMEMPAEYMFKDIPNRLEEGDDPVDITLGEMDKWGVDIGLIGLGREVMAGALRDHPDRFAGSLEVDPNDITGAVRKIRAAREEHHIRAVTTFPAGCNPQVPVSDRRYYPIYQTCIDLDIPIISNAGIAGPRFPSACQDVMHFDQVCYDFPELRVVMRHGAEPWEALAVKLMLKWPNLYYMTSAFAPRYYPKAIIDYANTRGAEKVMYAGYFPMGLSLERIFTEMPNVPFRDHVWPRFLRENAMRVFKLDD